MPAAEHYVASTSLPVSETDAFSYHDRPGALQRLIPPWESAIVERSDGSLAVGSEVVLKTSLFGVPLRWLARHTEYDPPQLFADTQVSGPFAQWDHRHSFSNGVANDAADNPSQTILQDHCVMKDAVTYRLPLGMIGKMMGGGLVKGKLESMFAYRHRVTRDDLQLLREYPFERPLNIAISGSTGLVGSALGHLVTLLGHSVTRLVRSPDPEDPDAIAPWSEGFDRESLQQVDAVVHLAGKPIGDSRWTAQSKKEMVSSRVVKTRELCDLLAGLENGPKTLICASATGYFGDRGDEVLDESSAPGDGFLPDLCVGWERACDSARAAGIRVVNTRFGIVLSPRGGALSQMLLPAKFCGGRLGSGDQWWSWIGLDDCIGAIYHALMRDDVSGPMNVVSPQPMTNKEFAATLGRVIRRPALMPAPAFALRMALGEMADALLLASARVTPDVLVDSGYRFRFTNLESQLSYLLGRESRESIE
ncbi:TIGR01777 family oxidoreductase [Stieleria varia]|uniref:Epimerase family protein n=1 Tax=Stieleria varia TaxID=2528005 RepID=A0A5C5ZL88_9BACT|nr:TIGR01777 family oxidoreductase [Stieleria varia]TWT87925.1 Epimerase family protein [Stieleria varia]